MWSGTLHDTEFVTNVLKHVEENEDKYGTSARMKGMLTVAKEVSGLVPHTSLVQYRLSFCPGIGHAVLLHAVQSLQPFPLRLPKLGRDCVGVVNILPSRHRTQTSSYPVRHYCTPDTKSRAPMRPPGPSKPQRPMRTSTTSSALGSRSTQSK